MERIPTRIQPGSTAFRENRARVEGLVKELRKRLDQARAGGPPQARERHRARRRLLVRERIDRLIDPGQAFLELSPLAAQGIYTEEVPAAGLVTGIGPIAGRPTMVIANDATVKGGTFFPLTVKKHLRAQEIALANRLPCVYLVDSGGAFLPLQAEIFPDERHGGRMFYLQAVMSAAGIPQMAVVMGSCTAGAAYIPAMCDENIIVRRQGTIFLGGPPLVRAATGEEVTPEELGGGDVHTRTSGVSDHLATDDADALERVREAFRHLPPRPESFLRQDPPEEPYYDPAELYGIVPPDPRTRYDAREVIARLVDGSRFHEFKALYGTTLVCGIARLHGYPVGILANNGVLFSEAALKGTHFIVMCCQRRIPLLFLQNITGFIVGKRYEHGGITKDGAKMVHAVANAQVPKLSVIVGASHGAGNYAMCGRAYAPRFLFSWPTARISVMGGDQAAETLLTVKRAQLATQGRMLTEEEAQALAAPIRTQYEREGSPFNATARLWDDGLLDPLETRQVLSLCLDVCARSPVPEPRFGVFRM